MKKLFKALFVIVAILAVSIFSYKYLKTKSDSLTPSFNPHYNAPIKSIYNVVFEVVKPDYLGDYEQAHRLAIAAQHLGWKTHIVDSLDDEAAQSKLMALKPDFVITIIPHIKRTQKLSVPNYVILSLGSSYYFPKHWYTIGSSVKDYTKKALLFDGILLSDANLSQFAKYFADNQQPFYGMTYYPYTQTLNDVDFSLSRYQNPKLLISGTNWDSKRRNKFAELYKQLAATGYTDFYGPPKTWQHLDNAYKGFVPVDGVSFLNILQQHGVALLLHSKAHDRIGTPSGRIFEAAAAGNIIISDYNDFVIKHFGDNVLYIDVEGDSDDIFKQIEQHMQWIRNNPEKAKIMAEGAHQIFLEKYTAEQCLLQLAKMHETMLNDKKVAQTVLQ